jgi:hypothetical protein
VDAAAPLTPSRKVPQERPVDGENCRLQ